MSSILGILLGFFAWFAVRHGFFGFYTVDQNERAVKTVFGRAQRLSPLGANAASEPNEEERYSYPALRVIGPGGPYFKLPWEQVHKVSVATETTSMARDPETPRANSGGKILEAVTKDQLKIGLTGQIRFGVSERNLYAYLFAVKNPLTHVLGYFVSVLRERISTFEMPHEAADESGLDLAGVSGISINDLRKNLTDLNDHMLRGCESAESRYGIVLDASLITGIDPPPEVESALAAINTAHNHVSSEVSLAQAAADQTIVQSKRAVEIATLRAQAEVEPLVAVADRLAELKQGGGGTLGAYLRNVRLSLFERAQRVFLEMGR